MTKERDPSITIGVVIVAFDSQSVLENCLVSLAASSHASLKIVVCDNASPDASADVVRRWASESSIVVEAEKGENGGFLEVALEEGLAFRDRRLPVCTLLRLPSNLGFAGGVNAGLKLLRQDPEVSLFWVLNPDTEVPTETASVFARRALTGDVGLMGGRIIYRESPNRIQSDGGRVGRWSGICRNVNQGADPEEAQPPSGDSLDFLMGASIVASRAFLDQAGLMQEDYFLYYEEVDWAFRRGKLPLDFLADAVVYHHGGTSIGTGNVKRRASGFANYFNYRNRMRFVARHKAWTLPVAYLISVLKVIQILVQGTWEEAYSAFCGLHQLSPPAKIAARLGPEAARMAFGRGSPNGRVDSR